MLAAVLASLLTAAAASPPSSGPTLAREDTMHTEVPPVLVSAPRVTLNEILDRVARGEARRDSMLSDETFVATFRVVHGLDDQKGPRILAETIARVYKKKPGRVRTVTLRHYEETKDPKKKKKVQVRFRADTDEEIVNFAFRPEARRDFKYRILGRDLVGNHLIYRIAFEPKSPLDPSQPSGVVWVDTNEFVIIRQEVSFARSPAPLFIKGVDRMVIERQNVEGYWVLWRVLMRVETTISIPKFGKAFDVSILFDQYAINHGIDDAIFNAKQTDSSVETE